MFLILKKIIRFYKFYKGPFNKWSEAKKKKVMVIIIKK